MSGKNDRELSKVTVLYGPDGSIISTSKQFTRVEPARYWARVRTLLFACGVISATVGTVLYYVRA